MPSQEYEQLRRRAYRDTKELWRFARSKLETIGKEDGLETKVG